MVLFMCFIFITLFIISTLPLLAGTVLSKGAICQAAR